MRWIFLALLLPVTLWGQVQNEKLEIETLEQIKTRLTTEFAASSERVANYSSKNNIPIFQRFADGDLQLIDVDQYGIPVYLRTYNAELALSTNVVKLRAGGGLNLDLKGNGMTVGVWDSGPVFEHNEFTSRILTREGGTVSDHATHVTGTILATGLNANAMGMAPLASLHSYDWTNDRAEMAAMAKPDQTGLLFSNHSYGIVQGWNCSSGSCQWTGNPAISDREDWRFGFYTTLARDLDQIAFNAPYYSIFWAAGNDRDDFSNSGVYPQDGNQGSGYDCIGQEGTAKNIFTIGASRKVTDYQGPASVEMSSFSGWGPTDDGRIKPDLVAPGVSIFSTVSDNGYASLNGTSMATPGAMGSLVLLQELHRDLHNGQFMRSATLKALAIHTAKEAGLHPGPDYSFGWGLIDVEAGAKVLQSQDDVNVFVKEISLADGQVFELELFPQENTRITATIAWTDPAGTPVASSLDPTNLMLVNDLDLRLVDDANNQQFPWALNPQIDALGTPAFKADNFRDNVEKLEFENPEPRPYKLRVSHKGTLTNGSQAFSLILTYTRVETPLPTLYWVGGPGNFNDPAHWSLTSGGPSSGLTPGANDHVVVDENSMLNSGESIEVTTDISLGALTWLSKVSSALHLNSHTLTISGDVNFGSGLGFITSGQLTISGPTGTSSRIISKNTQFSQVDLIINTGECELNGGIELKSLNLEQGKTILKDRLAVQSIQISTTQAVTLTLTDAYLTQIKDLDVSSSLLTLESSGSTIEPADDSQIDLGDRVFEGKILITADGVTLNGNNTLGDLEIVGRAILTGNNEIDQLTLSGNSKMELTAGTSQVLGEKVLIQSTETERTVLQGMGGKAALNFDGRFKLCFNFLDISGVDAVGDAVVNAGLASTLTNSLNWAKDDCEDILFPDFEIRNNCAAGIVELIDKSGGEIEAWQWTATGNHTLVREDQQEAIVVFPAPGTYDITLTISNSNDTRSYKQAVQIVTNDVPANTIILNGLNLFSSQPSESYQWYRDYQEISGATGRSYPFNGEPGSYFVLTQSSTCNRVSNTILITAITEDPETPAMEFEVFPNPAETNVTIRWSEGTGRLRILTGTGAVVIDQEISAEKVLDTSNWPRGFYVITVTDHLGTRTKKLILR